MGNLKPQGHFFKSSPVLEPVKRANSDAPEDSPTAKRAKRVKRGKKHRSKNRHSDGYTFQDDWVSFTGSPAPSNPLRGDTPVKPLTPFPLKAACGAHVKMSAEKLDGINKTEAKDLGENVKGEEIKAKTECNSVGDVKHSSKKNGTKSSPIVKTESGDDPLPDAILDFIADAMVPVHLKASPSASSSKSAKKTGNSTATPVIVNGNKSDVETAPALTPAPAGTKTLKSINRHLKALENKIDALTSLSSAPANTNTNTNTNPPSSSSTLPVTNEAEALQSLHTDMISSLHQRLDLAELRATVRHEILFNALVKISTDIAKVGHDIHVYQQQQQQQQQQQHQQSHSHGH